MRYAPWVAGGSVVLIAILAVVAILLVPDASVRPPRLQVEGAKTPAPGAPVPPSPGQTIYVVEQVSPIVSGDDTLNESLGFESPVGRFRAVLPKGTPVRYARAVTFSTSVDDQKEIRIHVLRGRSEKAAENHSLGWVRVPDLPPGSRGQTRVAMTFQVVDGAIVLRAQNAADGRFLRMEASEAPPGYGR